MKYQDIALAVAKVACLASCASQDADAQTLYSALGATQGSQLSGPAGVWPWLRQPSGTARLWSWLGQFSGKAGQIALAWTLWTPLANMQGVALFVGPCLGRAEPLALGI